jgi:hypothetical protein
MKENVLFLFPPIGSVLVLEAKKNLDLLVLYNVDLVF